MATTIFVEDISGICSISDIEKEFSPFGEICDIRITTSPKAGQTQQYGFVEYKTIEFAQSALVALNGKELCGVPMR